MAYGSPHLSRTRSVAYGCARPPNEDVGGRTTNPRFRDVQRIRATLAKAGTEAE